MSNQNSISLPPRVKDLTDRRFGLLVILRYAESRHRRAYWLCRCDCGREILASGGNLRAGDKKSCGCYTRQLIAAGVRTHGLSYNYIYTAWKHMCQRCQNPNESSFHNYGGRGIVVCERWRHSFVSFAKDMGPRPSSKHTLERIDNDGNYKPTNCRWATHLEQHRNTRANRIIEHNGEVHCLAEWAEITGLSHHCIRWRLLNGWSVADALTVLSGVPRDD